MPKATSSTVTISRSPRSDELTGPPPNLIPVKSVRFHQSVQFEGGLGAKSKLTVGEQGCFLYWDKNEKGIVVILPKHNPQMVTSGIQVFTLA